MKDHKSKIFREEKFLNFSKKKKCKTFAKIFKKFAKISKAFAEKKIVLKNIQNLRKSQT